MQKFNFSIFFETIQKPHLDFKVLFDGVFLHAASMDTEMDTF